MQIYDSFQLLMVVGTTGHSCGILVRRAPQNKIQRTLHICRNMACIRAYSNIQIELGTVRSIRTDIGVSWIASQNLSILKHCDAVTLFLTKGKVRIPEAIEFHISY